MMKNLFLVEGRMRRKHYWLLWLIVLVANLFSVFVVDIYLGYPETASLISMLAGVFLILQGIKRMHDTDHTGWFLLAPIYNLILLFTPGSWGTNRYGADPKEPDNKSINGLKDVLDAPSAELELQSAQGAHQAMIYFIVLIGMGYLQSILSRIIPLSFVSNDSGFSYLYYYSIFVIIELAMLIYMIVTVRNAIAKTALTVIMLLNIYFFLDYLMENLKYTQSFQF
jgi:uncharacterized membrane protein YhaH (DUF805 family)